jgi:hypothetical protein
MHRTSRAGVSIQLTAAILLLVGIAGAQSGTPQVDVFQSRFADHEVALSVNPESAFWRAAQPVYLQSDIKGQPLPKFRTTVRSRWTQNYLYFLFECPYEDLYLKPNPDTGHETYELWNWNVAEVFIGSDFKNVKRYREFEISPQGEWIDLDVDISKPHHEKGWVWNSGFEHIVRINRSSRIWYAALRIPFAALDTSTPKPSTEFRVNLFRTEGSPASTKEIVWQPTMSDTFHVPERFGVLKLTK